MKVFVVIVTYNPAKWIDRCFSSLRKSYIPVQAIVIDNGSSDGSVDLIKRNYPEVDLIISNENLGFGKANNIGIKKAYDSGADYVLLLNQDAWMEGDTIKTLIDYHCRQNDFDIISPIHLDGTGNNLDHNFSTYLTPHECKNLISDLYLSKLKHVLYEIKFVNAACWLVTRKCIETVGGFNPLFYHYGEDNNYLDRLHFHGLKIGICPFAKIYHDRNQEIRNSYFDQDELVKRGKLLKYVDPSNSKFIDSEIANLSKLALFQFITGRIKKSFRLYQHYKDLKNKSREYKNNSLQSSLKGLTFL